MLSEEKLMVEAHHPFQVVPDEAMSEQEQIDLAMVLSLSMQDHPPPTGEGEEPPKKRSKMQWSPNFFFNTGLSCDVGKCSF